MRYARYCAGGSFRALSEVALCGANLLSCRSECGSATGNDAVFVCGQPLDNDGVAWPESMVGEEFPPRAAAAEDGLVACDVGFCRFGKPREVHREQRSLPVARVSCADRICGEKAQVASQVDVVVVEGCPGSD